jgi:hypothetical protein
MPNRGSGLCLGNSPPPNYRPYWRTPLDFCQEILTLTLPMTRIYPTEKQLQGEALSSLGAYPCLVAGRLPFGNPETQTQAADAGIRFRCW